MHPRDTVELDCYNTYGECMLRTRIGTYEWYEELHPIVDDDVERKRLGVVQIFGRQFDLNGDLIVRWRAAYEADGSITDLWEWIHGGATRHIPFAQEGI
jgi:hypothetical protein